MDVAAAAFAAHAAAAAPVATAAARVVADAEVWKSPAACCGVSLRPNAGAAGVAAQIQDSAEGEREYSAPVTVAPQQSRTPPAHPRRKLHIVRDTGSARFTAVALRSRSTAAGGARAVEYAARSYRCCARAADILADAAVLIRHLFLLLLVSALNSLLAPPLTAAAKHPFSYGLYAKSIRCC
ncbi:hypothetical protein ACSSS7_004199 [Eimeria intestinalis]